MRTREEVQAFLVEELQKRSPKARKTTLTPETNLIQTGILDSFAFLDLVSELEGKFSIAIDLEGHEFEVVSTLGGLCDAVVGAS